MRDRFGWGPAKEAGFNKICGADYSQRCLRCPKKSIYENLIKLTSMKNFIGLTGHLAVSSVLAHLPRHIQINAFRELVRITKQDGFVCITARDSYWEEEPFMELLATMRS